MLLSYCADTTHSFAILMRLRQAVLHPMLVLQNITRAEAQGGKAETMAELVSIRDLITRYSSGESKFEAEALRELEKAVASGDIESEDQECPVCFDVRSLVFVCQWICLTAPRSSRIASTCPACISGARPA